jgi:ribosomal protein S17
MSSNNDNIVGNAGRLRRSSRAPKKSSAEFSVGDVVEVRRTSRLTHDKYWNPLI